jgi:hypothetical protein
VAYLLSFTVGNFRANFGIIQACNLQDPHFPVPVLKNQLVDLKKRPMKKVRAREKKSTIRKRLKGKKKKKTTDEVN